MSHIEVSRKITRRVRGLHLALKMLNKSDSRFGRVNYAVTCAKAGNYAEARKFIKGLNAQLQFSKAKVLADPCAAPMTEVSVEAMTSFAPVTLRFTPAGAKLLGLDGRATTKYVEVSMAKASAVVLRNKLYSLRRAPGLNQLKTIDAALTVLDAAGIN